MVIQTELDFTSGAPINTEKLTGQNRLVYDILRSGKTLTCYQAQDYGITALNSRISDLRNKVGITVYDRFITTSGGSKVKEYSLRAFRG
jgi:hypothetical protein